MIIGLDFCKPGRTYLVRFLLVVWGGVWGGGGDTLVEVRHLAPVIYKESVISKNIPYYSFDLNYAVV